MEQFIPYYYEDLTVPPCIDGSPDKSYRQYIEWLAEYLNENNFTLSPKQNKWIQGLRDRSSSFIVLILSDDLAMYEMEREIIVSCIEDNMSYEEILEDEREQWESCLTGDPDIDTSFEETCLTQEEFECIKREIIQENTIEHLPGDADIPVRGILKIAIEKCKSKQERIDTIKYFFDNYNYMAAK